MGGTPKQFNLDITTSSAQVFGNGQPPSASGAKQLMLACSSYPSAGTVSVDYQLAGDSTWRRAPKATNLPMTGPQVVALFGAIVSYRVVLAGITGGSNFAAWLSDIDAEGFPPGAFVGLRALTTQGYVEANVKNGVQYEASSLNLAVPASPAAGSNLDVVVSTGAKPVLIKLRKIDFNGLKLEARVYENVVFTAGTGTPIPYYNMNRRNPVPGLLTARFNPTITNMGQEAGAPTFGIGSTGQGQTVLGSYSVSGIERLLDINKVYLLRITNTSAAPQDIATYLSWYEGDSDLPT